ncbi:hypothetical protein HPP92_016976 [Vanilla planifolia]|uniref:Bifunctional inhibitor/plant lipid transfer protein/seed storage helical domain-containing protein n=1 Tax=Vanilla planifolia TaxID=51239 RepID=A0A835QCZ9_VANPL|nr:hypothetical protein HPP92_017556 [Vanilla planifolia]KAG0472430.1 hypothetical protein HPP92_016976 [Vanilla planifolia]
MPKAKQLVLPLVVAVLVAAISGDIAADHAECAQDLVGLSTCLEYVSGNARNPTPDCCAGLQKVRSRKPKCLCVLIKDHDSPDLGFRINVTLAVFLPAVCHVPANISHCPKLLNLPPDSKEAEIFKQPAVIAAAQGQNGNGSDQSIATTATGSGNKPLSDSSAAAGMLTRGQAGGWIRALRVEMAAGIWICYAITFLAPLGF